MQLSEHDQSVLDGMKKQLEELTGKKATHVFIDTKDTIKECEFDDEYNEKSM
mgnify:CR=1 FL=1